MLKVAVSNSSPGPFDITCKEIVSEERKHGGKVFLAFVIPTYRLGDLIKAHNAWSTHLPVRMACEAGLNQKSEGESEGQGNKP